MFLVVCISALTVESITVAVSGCFLLLFTIQSSTNFANEMAYSGWWSLVSYFQGKCDLGFSLFDGTDRVGFRWLDMIVVSSPLFLVINCFIVVVFAATRSRVNLLGISRELLDIDVRFSGNLAFGRAVDVSVDSFDEDVSSDIFIVDNSTSCSCLKTLFAITKGDWWSYCLSR